jgi:hypothetical protein
MGFAVDPEQMRHHGRGIEDVGRSAGEDLRSLRDAVSGNGAPWGGDEAGSAFGEVYTELVSLAEEVLRILPEGIETVGYTLQVSADAFDELDGAGREGFDTIAGELGGLR